MILLASCASVVDSGITQSSVVPDESTSVGQPSVDQPSSIDVPQSSEQKPESSSVTTKQIFSFEADKDIGMYQVLSSLIPEGEFEFKLPEFSPYVFKTVAVNNSIDDIELYFNNTKIIDGMNHESDIFASDINGDHYREIVCITGKILVIYDVHNSYEMLNKDLSKDNVFYLENVGAPYKYDLELYQEKLILKVWNGSRTDRNYDYAYFNYDTQFNFLSINLQNMYEIQEFGYDSIYKGEELIERENDVYTLEKGVEYLFNFHITRKENADLSKVIEGFANTKEELPTSGIYVLINGQLQTESNVKIRCLNDNGFGDYTLKLTLPDNASEQGQIYVGYAFMSFALAYKLA